jgi:hypothetical protein
MAKTKFPGVPIVLNGETLLIPSLSLRQVQENYDLLSKPFEITTENLLEHFDTFLPIIALAIQRNYPDVAEDDLRDWLALSSFYKVLAIVKGVSGLTEVDSGE